MLEGDSSASTQTPPKKSDRTVVIVAVAIGLALIALVAFNMN